VELAAQLAMVGLELAMAVLVQQLVMVQLD